MLSRFFWEEEVEEGAEKENNIQKMDFMGLTPRRLEANFSSDR